MAKVIGVEIPSHRWTPKEGMLIVNIEYGTHAILMRTGGFSSEWDWFIVPLDNQRTAGSLMFNESDKALMSVTTKWVPLEVGQKITLIQED